MTKQIRVENACGSMYKVIVQVWDKGQDGAADTMAMQVELGCPTAMASLGITSTRYLVVKEAS